MNVPSRKKQQNAARKQPEMLLQQMVAENPAQAPSAGKGLLKILCPPNLPDNVNEQVQVFATPTQMAKLLRMFNVMVNSMNTNRMDLIWLTAKQKRAIMIAMIKFFLPTWVGGFGRAFIFMIARWLERFFGHWFKVSADILAIFLAWFGFVRGRSQLSEGVLFFKNFCGLAWMGG